MDIKEEDSDEENHPLSMVTVGIIEDEESSTDETPIDRSSSGIIIECPSCSLNFGSKLSLNIHILRHHIENGDLVEKAPCPFCGLLADDLTSHCRMEHDVTGVVCPFCAKILSKTSTLNRHVEQVHMGLRLHRPVSCQTCGKLFSKKGHLDRHFKTIHLGIKESSEPCPHCGKVFSTKSSLEPHIEMVHNGVRKKCTECGKVLSDIWKHMRTVHGQYRRKTEIQIAKIRSKRSWNTNENSNQ